MARISAGLTSVEVSDGSFNAGSQFPSSVSFLDISSTDITYKWSAKIFRLNGRIPVHWKPFIAMATVAAFEYAVVMHFENILKKETFLGTRRLIENELIIFMV